MTGMTQDARIPILEADLFNGASQLAVVRIRCIWNDQTNRQSTPCAQAAGDVAWVVAKLRARFQNPFAGRVRNRAWAVIDDVGNRRRCYASPGSHVVARDPLLRKSRGTRMPGRLQRISRTFWHAARIQTMKPPCQDHNRYCV